MIVEPELLRSQKFTLLKQTVGVEALEYLCRLWSYCQRVTRGENLGPVDGDFVEAICEWRGAKGVLFSALLRVPSHIFTAGWVEQVNGDIVVHEWEQWNAALMQQFESIQKARQAKARRKGPVLAPSQAQAVAPENNRTGHNITCEEAHIPTEEEVIAFGGIGPGIHAEYCREYHAKKNERQGWIVTGGKLLDWRKEITRHWATWGTEWLGRYKKRAAVGEVQIDGMSVDDCKAELLNPNITEQRRQELITIKKRLEGK
jgi:hypothetical protein